MYTVKIALLRFLEVIYFLLFARVVISWVARGRQNKIIDLVYQLTEPILAPIREILNKIGLSGMIDFSVLFAFLLLRMLERLIIIYI